jgi:hypothetical protein
MGSHGCVDLIEPGTGATIQAKRIRLAGSATCRGQGASAKIVVYLCASCQANQAIIRPGVDSLPSANADV